jgi:hypothetical protein
MKLTEQKDIILNDFDFEKVEKVMKTLDWKWIDGGVPGNFEYQPKISDLKHIASTCLDNVINSIDDEDSCSIGGFEALKTDGMLELRFVLDVSNPFTYLNKH